MKINTKKFIFVILLIAAILRLINLSANPPHLTPDEAALGYNAYSILKTGKDEYGINLPIIFKSFGDYKPGLYVYLAVPSILIFGLNELAVRLPSALFGIVGVYLVYEIVKKLLEKQENKEVLALISSFLLAINPWHVHFSRGAWEVNVSLTLSLLGILFLLKALEKPKNLIYSSIFFSLTLLTYQGAKLSSLIILLTFLIIYWDKFIKVFKKNKKIFIYSLLIGVIISYPILTSFFQGKTGRLEVFSVFSYPRPPEYLNTFLKLGGEKVGDLNYYLYHTEGLNFLRGILGRWFNHYSDRFLFFEGDWQNLRHSSPYQGMFLVTEIIVIVFGIWSLIREKGRQKYLIFLWALLAPLPAVLSRDQVQAVRSLNLVIPLVFINAYGFFQIFSFASNKFKTKKLALIVGTLYLISFIYFVDSYFIHLPKHNAQDWYFGYKDVVRKVALIKKDYEKVIIQQSYDQPYIYYLFYTGYDPERYQAQAKLLESSVGDVGFVEHIDDIEFRLFSWPVGVGEEKTLVAGSTIGIPDDYIKYDFNLIEEIKYPDGFKVAFRIIETK